MHDEDIEQRAFRVRGHFVPTNYRNSSDYGTKLGLVSGGGPGSLAAALTHRNLQNPVTLVNPSSDMFEPVRGGTRGGQAQFKWSDVSADKDREVREAPYNTSSSSSALSTFRHRLT